MNARALHPAGQARAMLAPLDEDAMRNAPVGPACCCPAMAVVRVVMPPTAARPRAVDLLLCGHHYRVSRQALAAAHATVRVLPEASANPALALLHELQLPEPRVPTV